LTPTEQFVIGLGQRTEGLALELALGLIGAVPADKRAPEIVAAIIQGKPIPASSNQGDAIDQLKQINQLYIAAIDVVKADEAHYKGDYVQIGRSGLDVVTTWVMAIVAKKAEGKAGADEGVGFMKARFANHNVGAANRNVAPNHPHFS
jgi:hypothetical protein